MRALRSGQVHQRRLAVDQIQNSEIDKFQFQCIIDFVTDENIESSRQHPVFGQFYRILGIARCCYEDMDSLYSAESLPVVSPPEEQRLQRADLTCAHIAFHELHQANVQPVAHRAQDHSKADGSYPRCIR
jgi:hypothetical protein